MKMDKRQLKKSQYYWLASELSFLTDRGTLGPGQQDRILDNYEIFPEHRIDRGRLWLITFLSLGVLMFGFAVFLLLCHNWNYLTPFYKTLIASGSLVLFWGTSLILKAARKGILSELCYFFTGILFGVNIWQIAQIYHFNVDFPVGIWFWIVGLFLLAYGRKLPLLHYLIAFLLVIWVPAEISSSWSGIDVLLNGCLPWLPPAGYTLPILVGWGYYCGKKSGWVSVCLLYYLVFCWWTVFQCGASWDMEQLIPFYLVFLGGLNLLAARLVRLSIIARLMRYWGFLLIFVLLTFLTFSDYYHEISLELYTSNKWMSLVPFAAELILLILLGGAALRRFKMEVQTVSGRTVFSLFWPGGFAVLCVPLFLMFLLQSNVNKEIMATYASILMLAAAWWCILSAFKPKYIYGSDFSVNFSDHTIGEELTGSALAAPCLMEDTVSEELKEDEINTEVRIKKGKVIKNHFRGPYFYWFGIIYFILWSVFRYFDLFADSFGMLGASAMFALIGVILIFAGVVWFKSSKTRKSKEIELKEELIAKMQISGFLEESSRTDPEGEMRKMPFQPDLPLTTGEKIVLAFSLLFMLGTLAGMIIPQTLSFRDAVKITVETEPLDPRSMFRGDYVILNYSFSRTVSTRWQNGKEIKVFDTSEITSYPAGNGSSGYVSKVPFEVFTILKYNSAEKIWKPIKMCCVRPESLSEGEVVIKGRTKKYGYNIRYGIEQYFVQEGSGRRIERAMMRSNDRSSKVLVDLLVNPKGRARIVGVRIVEVKEQEEKKEAVILSSSAVLQQSESVTERDASKDSSQGPDKASGRKSEKDPKKNTNQDPNKSANKNSSKDEKNK